MRQLFSYYDNITLIFANLILKYKNEIKIFENQKSSNYLFIRYLNLFLYIILFREIYSLQILAGRKRFPGTENTP